MTDQLWNFGIAFVVQSLEVKAVCFLRTIQYSVNKELWIFNLPISFYSANELWKVGQLEAVERGWRLQASQIVRMWRETGEIRSARRGELL